MAVKPEFIGLRGTTEQRQRWEQAAAADRRTLTDWIRIQLDDAADRQLAQQAPEQKPGGKKK